MLSILSSASQAFSLPSIFHGLSPDLDSKIKSTKKNNSLFINATGEFQVGRGHVGQIEVRAPKFDGSCCMRQRGKCHRR